VRAPADETVGEHQREPARDEHGDPVTEHGDGRACAALLLAQHVGAIGVERNVLRRRAERDDHCHQRECVDRGGRPEHTHRRDADDQQALRHQHPAAAPAEQRRHETVHQRRPQELERVRAADERQKPDRLDVEAVGGGPRLQRSGGERERKPEAKPEQQHHADAPVDQRFAPCRARGRALVRDGARIRHGETGRSRAAPGD
jgi:hypothetical protein